MIATGHNNLAMNRGVPQVARRYVEAQRLTEAMLNRVEAVIRCYDPCLSCSTHALGQMPLHLQLLGPDGAVVDELAPMSAGVLVIGYGNGLRGDDGLGPEVVDALRADPRLAGAHAPVPPAADPRPRRGHRRGRLRRAHRCDGRGRRLVSSA